MFLALPSSAFCTRGSVGKLSALAVDDEHVLVCSRRQNGCPVPDTVAVVVAQVDQATAPVVERADDFNRTGSGEMADEVRDALTLARGGNGTLLPGQQQNRGKTGHQGQRPDWTQSEGDGPWTPEPPDHATYAIVREHVNRHLADLRRDAIRDAQPRRRLEQLGRRNQPGVRLPQIRRQLGRITLAIERFLQPWINWVHRTTSSSARSTSATCSLRSSTSQVSDASANAGAGASLSGMSFVCRRAK